MNDTELLTLWAALEPSARQRARVETRVFEWLGVSETSIAAEWLGLLRVEPLTALACASIGAVSLFLLTPVGWIAAWFLR
jgi:hypothetical protein